MDAISVFKALADESRLRLVSILDKGYFNVQELTDVLNASQSTVSHHLKTLQQAGIATSKKQGTWSYYTLANGNSPDQFTTKIVRNFLEANAADRSEEAQLRAILARRRDASRSFFDRVAPEWHRLRSEGMGQGTYLEVLAKQIPATCDLLELGCGAGALLQMVTPRKGITLGVDFSQSMLDEARRSLPAAVDLRLGYLEHLPIADASVDMVVAYMVFHHLADPTAALKDAYRVLKPQGTIAVIDLTEHTNEQMRELFADLWLGFSPTEFSKWATHGAGFKNAHISLLGEKEDAFLFTAVKNR